MNEKKNWKIIVTLENGESAQTMEIFSTRDEASKTLENISKVGFLLLLPNNPEPIKIEPHQILNYRIENKLSLID